MSTENKRVAEHLPEPSEEEAQRAVDRILMRLKHAGGRWVPSSELTPGEIAFAQAACDDRWYVNDMGFGWAWCR